MDGNQGPEVVPAGHGAEGIGATDCGARESGVGTDAAARAFACPPDQAFR